MIRRFALGAADGAFFLWLALRNVSLGEIAATLRGASLPIFVLFVLMHVGSLGLRAVRWRLRFPKGWARRNWCLFLQPA